MPSILCELINPQNIQNALEELQNLGLRDHYILEDYTTQGIQIGGVIEHLPKKLFYSKASYIDPQVNWDEQSKIHSPFYKNGLLEIDLNDFNPKLPPTKFLLRPGPGFGDISHDTTQLMLSSLYPYVKDRCVLDLGCGNGILSLASYFLGAKKITGIDIDDAALIHAKENLILNNLSSSQVFFGKEIKDKNYLNNHVILMNMTYEEQLSIFKKNCNFFKNCTIFISSGILGSQSFKYKKILFDLKFKLLINNKLNKWNNYIFIK